MMNTLSSKVYFAKNEFKDKTIQEVIDSGDRGVKYILWALENVRTFKISQPCSEYLYSKIKR